MASSPASMMRHSAVSVTGARGRCSGWFKRDRGGRHGQQTLLLSCRCPAAAIPPLTIPLSNATKTGDQHAAPARMPSGTRSLCPIWRLPADCFGSGDQPTHLHCRIQTTLIPVLAVSAVRSRQSDISFPRRPPVDTRRRLLGGGSRGVRPCECRTSFWRQTSARWL